MPCDCNCCKGACCCGTSCTQKTCSECADEGGVFLGNGTQCDEVECDPPTGACCQGYSCSVTSQCECEGAGGVYQGDDTDCDPNPCACESDEDCPSGQCCWQGECQDTPCPICECNVNYECAFGTSADSLANTYLTGCSTGVQSDDCEREWSEYTSGTTAEPDDWAWASGYPAAFNGCPYLFVASTAVTAAPCDSAIAECVIHCKYIKTEYRVWLIDCETGTASDVTADASADGQPVYFTQISKDPGKDYDGESYDDCDCNGSFPTPPSCEPSDLSCYSPFP